MQYRRDHWTERSRASQNRCVMSLLMHREPEKGEPDLPPLHQHIPDHDWRLADEPSRGSATAITDAHRSRHPSLHRDHHPDGDTHPAGTHQRTTPALWHCALSDRSVSHCEWPGTMKRVSAPSPKHQQPTGHCLTPPQTFAPTTNGGHRILSHATTCIPPLPFWPGQSSQSRISCLYSFYSRRLWNPYLNLATATAWASPHRLAPTDPHIETKVRSCQESPFARRASPLALLINKIYRSERFEDDLIAAVPPTWDHIRRTLSRIS